MLNAILVKIAKYLVVNLLFTVILYFPTEYMYPPNSNPYVFIFYFVVGPIWWVRGKVLNHFGLKKEFDRSTKGSSSRLDESLNFILFSFFLIFVMLVGMVTSMALLFELFNSRFFIFFFFIFLISMLVDLLTNASRKYTPLPKPKPKGSEKETHTAVQT